MRIESKQIELFSKLARADFDRRAHAYLCAIETDWGGISAGALTAYIEHGVDHAASLAITAEVDVISYLELVLRLGPARWRSPEYAWIREYLREKHPANDRLSLVIERLRFDDRVSN